MMRERSRRQEAAVATLVELDNTRMNQGSHESDVFLAGYKLDHPVVTYDSGPLGSRRRKWKLLPVWLRKIIGEECFHRVVEIHLACLEIRDSDLDHLKEFQGLEILNLDGTNISDEGLIQLARFDELMCLYLAGTQVTDDGLDTLSDLPQLEELRLCCNDLTDKGLAKLAILKNLKRINVCRTAVTEDGVARLRQALPHCKIWWDGCEAFHLINRSPNSMGRDDPNPAALIRAVNYLHSLGHDGAVEVLREYARIAPGEDLTGERETCDQSRLCLILPVLFQRKNPQQGIPMSPVWTSFVGKPRTRPDWPHGYVSVEDDIPFHNVVIGIRSGPLFPRRNYLVEWADKACRLRPSRLRPEGNPFAAASHLAGVLERNAKARYWLEEHLNAQAERMVSHLNLENPEEAKLRWSDERQEYVLAEAPRE